MNANIAEYHVPVNADVQDIKVIFVDEPDEIINPLMPDFDPSSVPMGLPAFGASGVCCAARIAEGLGGLPGARGGPSPHRAFAGAAVQGVVEELTRASG
jgi:hypothetical protein